MMAQSRDSQNKANSLSDAREFYDPESGSSSGATDVPDQSSTILSSRTLPHCDSGLLRNTLNGTGFTGHAFERPPAQEGLSSTIFNNSRIWHPSLKNWSWYSRNSKKWNEKRIDGHVESITLLPKQKWNVKSYWWNSFSQWYDGLSECSYYGMESWNISRLFGISKLESQLQNWGLSTNSRSSDHNALDQRSWDCWINWRTYDIAIVYRTASFSRFRHAWCDDCVRLEEAHHHAVVFLEKSKCRRAASSEFWPIPSRKTDCAHDLRVFPCNWCLWSSTRTLNSVRLKFAEWRYTRFRCEMWSCT